MMDVDGLVTYRGRGKVGYIGLNRPEKLNAVSPEMMKEFRRTLSSFTADDEARVRVLYAEGGSFCVGMDLSPGGYASSSRPASEDRERIQEGVDAWLRIWDCPKPVIAQVHGHCIAAGTQLPIFCDLVTTASNAEFGWPKVPVGGGYISPMWSWFVGLRVANQMSFVTGSTMTGQSAYEVGYANYVFPPDELSEKTRELADEVALMPSDLLRTKKLALNRQLEVQGFRSAVLAGVEWDALAHTTAGVQTMKKWLRDDGIHASIERYRVEGL